MRRSNCCHCFSPRSASTEAVRWDGAASETTGAVHIEAHDVYAYVELRVTGRAPRTLDGGIFGTKARARFTGQDDSGEWLDAIVYKAK